MELVHVQGLSGKYVVSYLYCRAETVFECLKLDILD